MAPVSQSGRRGTDCGVRFPGSPLKNYDFLQGKPKNSYNIKGIRRGTSDFKTMELT